MTNALQLYAPNGQELTRVTTRGPDNIMEGQGKIIGFSPWRDVNLLGNAGKGAILKRARWADYYDMYRQHSIVRAAIDLLANTSANVDFDYVPRDSRAKIKKREVTVLKNFFAQQHDFPGELLKIYEDLLIYGDAYLYIVPDRRRRPVRLKRLHPKTISIKANINGEILNYYQKNLDDPRDDVVTFGPLEIVHFKINDPDNDLYGLSPLESLKYTVATDLYAQRFNGAFFKNSGVTGTVIVINTADPNEMERNRKFLTESYTGPDQAHKPLILQGESIDVKKMTNTHHEMGFLELRKFVILEILAVMHVPPTKIGITESANRSNSKEQDNTFRNESIQPLQKLVEHVLNDRFVRAVLGVEETIIVHSEGNVRDAQEQMSLWTAGEKMGIYTINEVRAKLGMADIPGGDIAFIMSPTGAVPVEEMPLYSQIPQVSTTMMEQTHPGAAATQQALVSGDKRPTLQPKALPAKIKPNSASAAVKAIAASSEMRQAIEMLEKSHDDDASLRQAYAYMHDLSETVNDPKIMTVQETLRKACSTNDPYLRLGYIERAFSYVDEIIELENNGMDNDYE